MPTCSLYTLASALLASLLSSPVYAQLYTSCNPLNATCPADPALGTDHTFIFNSTPPTGTWNSTAGTVDYSDENGAAFTVAKQGDSPTLVSNFYFFWGRTEVIMKAANGTGIISSIVWSSDVLDEVDWECFGSNITHVGSNYFGKGRQDYLNALYHPVPGGDLQNVWVNYTNTWTNTSLEFYIDGSLVRTLLPADANSTHNYPQTPMKLSLGIWAGGDPDNGQGTIDWAGGETNYDDGPYTMYVKSARVDDYSSGKTYSYSDNSGDWTSIKIASGNSSAVEAINTPAAEPEESISEKWDELSSTTKTGVYAGVAAAGALALVALVFYYIRQRKRGQTEAALAAQRMEQDRMELEQFRKEGRDPDALAYEGTEYDAATMSKSQNVNVGVYGVPDDDSRSNSLHSAHGAPETAQCWDPTASGGGAMRSPMPLLRDDMQDPRVGSPGPQGFNPDRNNGFSSIWSQSPGMPSPFPPPASPGPRSFSSPNAPMRMGSPGPQAGGYVSVNRTMSPPPMQQENRSFTAPQGPGGCGNGGGYDGGHHGGNAGWR